MFDILLTFATYELYRNAEALAEKIISEELAREWIIILFQRTFELTEEQEKSFISLE